MTTSDDPQAPSERQAPDETQETQETQQPSATAASAEVSELELLRRRVRVLEVGAWIERAAILLIVLVTFPLPGAWAAMLIGGPVVVLFAIYVFIQRAGTKSSRPDS